jgi:hypothetical protein
MTGCNTALCGTPTAAQYHCTVCHHTFGALRAFDRHRVGKVGNRECLTPGALGLEQRAGVWREPMTPEARAKLEQL